VQKLSKRNTYTPRDASQVPGNCDHNLNNSEGRDSDYDLKTFDNNSDVNQLQKERRNLIVSVIYVLNRHGKPLMPCSQKKAKLLLKKEKAIVVKRKPFTIKLLNVDGGSKQETLLGEDIGSGKIGLSIRTNKKELYSSEVDLRDDIVKLISEKRMYRRLKRNKLWYRKPRFLNRKKDKGWLPPSIQHKLDSHIRVIDNVHKLLPVAKIAVEVAKFDPQKIKNPEIQGKEYQQGDQLGYENVRQYVLYRDGHECQYCKKRNVKLQIHHIVSRMTGGDAPDNLITLCEGCHKKHHLGKIELKIKKHKVYKAETCMNIIRNKIVEKLKEIYSNVEVTYGHITKYNRKRFGIEKSHINDAFVISGGSDQIRCCEYKIEQRRRNNRCLQISRKKYGISIRKERYFYQPMSLVRYKDKTLRVIGTQNYGKYIKLRDKKDIVVNVNLVKLIKYNEGLNYV